MTVEYLQAAGHNVRDVRGTSEQGMPDPDLWDTAISEGRLLITTDKGFTSYRAARHYGILVVRLRRPNRHKINSAVLHAMEAIAESEWHNRRVVVRDATMSTSVHRTRFRASASKSLRLYVKNQVISPASRTPICDGYFFGSYSSPNTCPRASALSGPSAYATVCAALSPAIGSCRRFLFSIGGSSRRRWQRRGRSAYYILLCRAVTSRLALLNGFVRSSRIVEFFVRPPALSANSIGFRKNLVYGAM
jgi:predicted nuclease of predicted toxin-antitoxin system